MSSLVDRRIAELLELDIPALRILWRDAFGGPAPKHISRDLLLCALAYRVQEQVEGGLSKAALKRLGQRPDDNCDRARPSRLSAPRLRPGTRLVREWRGEVHHVTLREDGFEYREKRYRSLSAIAREITGTRWSGPLFFGLRQGRAQREASLDD